jgi:uncharacterized protein
MLGGTVGTAAVAVLDSVDASAATNDGKIGNDFFKRRAPPLDFEPVAKNKEDDVGVPRHYDYDVLFALGDPISRSIADYRNDGTDSAQSFALRAGDHHDAIEYFGLGRNGKRDLRSSDRGLLCMNFATGAFGSLARRRS